MRLKVLLLQTTFILLLHFSLTNAQVQAPALEGQGAPISASDRIYTGDQSSNTITVIDPSQNRVLGTINLGDPRLMNDLNPQYVRSVNSHGLGFSRDGKYIVSLSTLTNTVTVISTSNNSVVSQTFVDRAPHEAFFAADNRTVWVGTRGVSSVNLVDGINGGIVDRIKTADGPSKVVFSPDGTVAYVNHIRAPIISVIDVPSKQVLYNITGLADVFSSDMMISADGGSLWAAHKMTGQVSVIDLAARKVIAILATGAETNHPNFAVVNGTTFAFVTVAALNHTKVYSQASPHDTPNFITAIQSSGIEPHGVWPSPDNTRVYIINEHSDTLDVVDTSSFSIIDTLPIGQEGQAVVYVAGAAPEGGAGVGNLGTQGLGLQAANILVSVASNETRANVTAEALITVRRTSGVDMFQLIGRNLRLNGSYTASAVCSSCGSGGDARVPLVSFKASTATKSGCGSAPQVLAFFKWFGVYDLESIHVNED